MFWLKRKRQFTDPWYIKPEDLKLGATGTLVKLLRNILSELYSRELDPSEELAIMDVQRDKIGVNLRWYKGEQIRVQKELEDTKCALEATSRKLASTMQERHRLQVKAGEIKVDASTINAREALIGASIANGDLRTLLKTIYGYELPQVVPEGCDLTLATLSELMSQLENISRVLHAVIMADPHLKETEGKEDNG